MTNKMNSFKEKVSSAKIAVLGLGISNIPLIRFLYSSGARDITAYDKFSSPQVLTNIETLQKEGMIKRAVTGEDYLEGIPSENYDIIFKSPIIRPDEAHLVKAVAQGACLTSEMELFLSFVPAKFTELREATAKLLQQHLFTSFCQLIIKIQTRKFGLVVISADRL